MNATDAARISIVTPTLNAETYLEECLRSVEAQHVLGLEHFVVDGGSHDRTEAIARQHAYIKWLSRPGLRQAAAINEGLRSAGGEVVAWLNADDLYVPDALEFVAREFAEYPDLDVLYGDCQVIDASGNLLWAERPGKYDFRRLLRRGNYIAQPAVFLRRRVFAAVGLLDESYDYGMDFELWLRLREQRVRYVPRPLARFRWHPDSKSATSQRRSWSEFLRIVRQHGGGWTPEIAFAYVRFLMTDARLHATRTLTGASLVRPLTRG
jgi:glycosyltransferase involved in cell wall biosynthesis